MLNDQPVLIVLILISRAVNHIHCIRNNCNYVLHSSGQLYSHKRKHERRDKESAYSKYKNIVNGSHNGDGGDRPPSIGNHSISSESSSTPPLYKQDGVPSAGPCSAPPKHPGGPLSLASLLSKGNNKPTGDKGGVKPPTAFNPYTHPQPPPPPPPAPFGSLPPGMGGPGGAPLPNAIQAAMFCQQTLMMTDLLRDKIPDEVWRDYLLHFEKDEGCGFQGCELEDGEHWHCKMEGCETVFKSFEGVWEHGRNHFVQDKVRLLHVGYFALNHNRSSFISR